MGERLEDTRMRTFIKLNPRLMIPNIFRIFNCDG